MFYFAAAILALFKLSFAEVLVGEGKYSLMGLGSLFEVTFSLSSLNQESSKDPLGYLEIWKDLDAVSSEIED